MYLSEPCFIRLEDQVCLSHSRVDLPCVPQIEAQTSIGQLVEHRGELIYGPANRLSLVHVLDTKQVTELSPKREIMYGVGVDNNRPTVRGKVQKATHNLAFIVRIEITRSVHCHIPKLRQVQLGHSCP